MLTQDNKMQVAVRLYDNPQYGTTYGKGLYRRAVYNGSIDTKSPNIKYVVDLFDYDDWSNQAKTDEQMQVLEAVPDVKDKLYSWVRRYDTTTKVKTLVIGVCTLDPQNMLMDVLIGDEQIGVAEHWQLSAKPCKPARAGAHAPTLLATNADLQAW